MAGRPRGLGGGVGVDVVPVVVGLDFGLGLIGCAVSDADVVTFAAKLLLLLLLLLTVLSAADAAVEAGNIGL